MLGKIRRIIKDPIYAGYYVLSKYQKYRTFKRYSQLSHNVGIKKLYFVLSFDCDTEEDAKVVWDVHSRLSKMGISPVYAVPGEVLIKDTGVYERIAETGAEFINHGFVNHTFFNKDTNQYESSFFYDKLLREIIKEDIIKGHQTIKEVLGVSPKGFRAPHFGTFQKNDQIRFIHSILKSLGYLYSTSTLPYLGLRYGAITDKFGIKEIPVSGRWRNPLEILDSWGCYYALKRLLNEQDYYDEGKAIASFFFNNNFSGILNFYADPSHIAKSELFFKTIEEWLKVAESVSYEGLLKKIG